MTFEDVPVYADDRAIVCLEVIASIGWERSRFIVIVGTQHLLGSGAMKVGDDANSLLLSLLHSLPSISSPFSLSYPL